MKEYDFSKWSDEEIIRRRMDNDKMIEGNQDGAFKLGAVAVLIPLPGFFDMGVAAVISGSIQNRNLRKENKALLDELNKRTSTGIGHK